MNPTRVRAWRSAGRRLICAVALLTACAGSIRPPTQSTRVPLPPSLNVTVYYVEGQRVEPWGPTAGGSFPTDWENRAKQDLAAAGLSPQTLTQRDLRSTITDPIICTGCPSGFILVVVLPSAELATALARCFVTAEPKFDGSATADSKPASLRTDCRPLYPRTQG